MPLQNRVTPFGDIVAIPQRGLFTGNRGIIHDPATRRLLARRWTSKVWIVCGLDYKGVRRDVMSRRSWTELFFLDEATALAAGHRPCFFCRRPAAKRFQSAWAEGKGAEVPKAGVLDETLHRERLSGRRKRLHDLPSQVDKLPDGTMVSASGEAYLIVGGRPFQWSPDGYIASSAAPLFEWMITPPSTVAALSAGYRPTLHPSAYGLSRSSH